MLMQSISLPKEIHDIQIVKSTNSGGVFPKHRKGRAMYYSMLRKCECSKLNRNCLVTLIQPKPAVLRISVFDNIVLAFVFN